MTRVCIPRLFCFILICGLSSASMKASAQQDSIVFRGDVEREFVEAMKSFTSQRYDTAASLFSKILRDYPRSHRSTGASIMAAKAYYHLASYRE